MTGYEALQLVQARVLDAVQASHDAQVENRKWIGSPAFKLAQEQDGKEVTIDAARLSYYLAMGHEEAYTKLSVWLAEMLERESPLWLPAHTDPLWESVP